MTPLTDNQLKAGALHASGALAHLEALRGMEAPKSARYNRLAGAIEAVGRVVDIYRLEAWEYDDLRNAEAVFDAADKKIRELYP